MDRYILDIRKKYGHMTPKKPQYLTHKYRPIYYGATQKTMQPTYTIPTLNDKGIKRIQGIVGALLNVCNWLPARSSSRRKYSGN